MKYLCILNINPVSLLCVYSNMEKSCFWRHMRTGWMTIQKWDSFWWIWNKFTGYIMFIYFVYMFMVEICSLSIVDAFHVKRSEMQSWVFLQTLCRVTYIMSFHWPFDKVKMHFKKNSLFTMHCKKCCCHFAGNLRQLF